MTDLIIKDNKPTLSVAALVRDVLLPELRADREVAFYAKHRLNQHLYENQQKIVSAICNPQIRNVHIMCARQGGKTHSVAIAAIYAAERNLYPDHRDITRIGIIANKLEQAEIDLERIAGILLDNKEKVRDYVDFKSMKKSRIVFIDPATNRECGIIEAKSANPNTSGEGLTYTMQIWEESQRLSDIVCSQILLPYGGAVNAKIVQVGTPRIRNHFYEASADSQSPISKRYYHIKADWTQCPILWKNSTIYINGVPYSRYVLERMPYTLKMEYFPDNPIVKIDGEEMHIWDIAGDMTEDDFRTQYMLEWLLDTYYFLSETEKAMLFSGTHEPLTHGRLGEVYIAGFDPAGEAMIGTGIEQRVKKANAALSIWRVNGDVMEKVWCDEKEDATIWEQAEWVYQMTNPRDGAFKCTLVICDYTGIGISIVNELERKGLPIVGVIYSRTEPRSGKNFKNAMFDFFKTLVSQNKVKYPEMRYIEKHIVFQRHIEEWQYLEKKMTAGINAKIEPPPDMLADGCNADVLAVWGAFAQDDPQIRRKLGIAPKRAVKPVVVRK